MEFNFIAPYYDRLSKIVFGDSIQRAKVAQYSNISKGSKVLFVGGGSGVSLDSLLKINLDLQIDFVEPSEKMMNKAKKRISKVRQVNFHQVPVENFCGSSYDCVITEFFFDLFYKDTIQVLMKIIGGKLNKDGIWIDTDFRAPQGLANKAALKMMYLFFRITSGVVAQKLVSTKPIFSQSAFEIENEQYFKKGFISSRLIHRN